MAVAGLQHVAGGIGRDAEQAGMAERDQAGITDQHVQPEREDGVEQNLAGDVDVINARHPMRHRDERDESNRKCDEARAHDAIHGTNLPNKPCGRNSSTSNIGRNSTKYASSGSIAWPKL